MKNKLPYIPRLLRFILISLLVSLALLTLMRIIFYFVFRTSGNAFSWSIMLKSFYLGFKYDLRLLSLLHLPLFFFGWIRKINIFDSLFGKRLWLGYMIFVSSFILLLYFVDFGYYSYFDNRINASALRFLYNPQIAGTMLWQSYPVFWILLFFAALIAVYALGIGWLIAKINITEIKETTKRQKIAIIFACVLFFFVGIYGKFSYYPLRWSDAYFSRNSLSSHMALNPVLFFFDTMKNKNISFSVEQTKNYYETMVQYLGVDAADQEKLHFVRSITGKQSNKTPNVVLVFLESFTYYSTGISGNPLKPSPYFDAMAKKGLLFTRFYTPSGGTARSIFTTVTGIPDIELVKTSSRNPLVVKQHTIINSFKNHQKYYFLGGSANWGEIRGLISHNITGLRIYEEGDYSSPRADVWGLSDLDLFKEAHQVFKQKTEKPFFALIQTAGNHKPYTIPKNNDGFQVEKISKEEAAKYGFRSPAAYNASRFMDHSLGRFLQLAQKEEYFHNTIFVFFGDHGLIRQAKHMHKAEEQLFLNRHHVPLVIYAPWLIPHGKVYNKVAGEVDVLPTIAGLAKIPYVNSTLGRDLLDNKFDTSRYAFTIKHHLGPEIGLIGDEYYFLVRADGQNKKLHRIFCDNPTDNEIKKYPEIAEKMEKICRGFYESARYMRYHNSTEKVFSQIK